MFIGHALLAFALVASLARWLGWDAQRALQVGILAGLFATLPDVDVLYAPVGLLGGVSGLAGATEAFWETGNVVHRGPTHSVVFGAIAAVAAGAWTRGTLRARAAAVLLLAGIVGITMTVSGLLGAVVVGAFAVGALTLARFADRWELSPAAVGGAALAGLVSHPFGDLFTGSPPAAFYPFDVTLVAERVVLNADPTLHLLAAFGVELATVWLAAVVALRLLDRKLRVHISRRATLGVGYAAAVLALPAPTLEASYQFVFTVLALAVVGFATPSIRRIDHHSAAVTGLTAVTLAGLSYAVAYVVVF